MARKSKILDIRNIDASSHPDDGGELSPGPGRESFKLAAFWKSQINAYEEATRRYVKRGNTVVRRYRDERNRVDEEGQRRMNLLWTTMQIMLPAIYSKCPIPIVDRKFLDRDPIGRLSSQMLERSLKNELENNGYHDALSKAVLDRLLPGKGVVWIRYEPEIGEGVSIPAPTINGVEDSLFDIGKQTNDKTLLGETEKEEKLETTNEQLISEKTEVDYVDWRDFYYFPVKARVWSEVQAICKKVYISKKEAIERFGEDIGKGLKPDTTPLGGKTEALTYSETSVFQDINERSIVIYEVWNKSDRRVYWLSSGYEYLCNVIDDPLELTGFFPVPPPLMATTTNDTLIPVPDYIEWQDQAIQIDELTQRLYMLTKACKVAGVYNSGAQGIKRVFDESVENELIPVDQWAMFADQGGLKGAMDFVPIDMVQQCIETLQKVRQQAMIDLDQVTGISDVIRGTSDSRETLGGLRLKNNNAGTRLSKSQEDVAEFAKNTLCIIAEIICKHFSDEAIIESSGIIYEDALQPDVIMREWQSEQPVAPEQPQGLQQAPQQPLQSAPVGEAPQLQQSPTGMQPGPQLGTPQTTSAMPQNSGNNIIPFPGMQQASVPLIPQPPDPKILIFTKIIKAIDLLRQDVSRTYRIDIETDSTIFGDKYQERQDATEFITAIGSFFKQFESVAQAAPEAMPLFGKVLQWGVRKYRTGRDLESEVDNFVTEITKKAKKLIENPPPAPEMLKAQAEIEQTKMEGQIQAQNDARDFQKQQQEDQRQAQLDQAQDQREQQKTQLQFQLEQMRMEWEKEQMQMEMEMKREEHAIKMKELQANLYTKAVETTVNMQSKKMDLKQREKEHQLDKKELSHKQTQQNQQHQQKMQQQRQQHKDKMKPKKKVS